MLQSNVTYYSCKNVRSIVQEPLRTAADNVFWRILRIRVFCSSRDSVLIKIALLITRPSTH